ncbi:hypothetical protein RCL1_003344 [Eukaryota sp. TZLM3-RCL]
MFQKLTCFKCGKNGHKSYQCQNKRQQINSFQTDSSTPRCEVTIEDLTSVVFNSNAYSHFQTHHFIILPLVSLLMDPLDRIASLPFGGLYSPAFRGNTTVPDIFPFPSTSRFPNFSNNSNISADFPCSPPKKRTPNLRSNTTISDAFPSDETHFQKDSTTFTDLSCTEESTTSAISESFPQFHSFNEFSECQSVLVKPLYLLHVNWRQKVEVTPKRVFFKKLSDLWRPEFSILFIEDFKLTMAASGHLFHPDSVFSSGFSSGNRTCTVVQTSTLQRWITQGSPNAPAFEFNVFVVNITAENYRNFF